MTTTPCSVCSEPINASLATCPSCGAPRSNLRLDVSLVPGSSLSDHRYRVDAVLGQGGFGITYRAYDTRLQRIVAIKEMFPHGSMRSGNTVVPATHVAEAFAQSRTQFIAEARALARLRHRSIVQVFEVFEEGNTAYLVMEFLDGPTYEELVQRQGPLPAHEVNVVLRQLAGALATIHADGLLHRDVKPSNVISSDGHPVLIDFGAARSFTANQSQDMSRVVSTGYSPLEQYSGHAKFGPPSDIYSLAATGYFLLSGAPPMSPADRIQGFALDRPTPASPPSAVEAAVMAGLAIGVNDRPADTSAFVALLDLPATDLQRVNPDPGATIQWQGPTPTAGAGFGSGPTIAQAGTPNGGSTGRRKVLVGTVVALVAAVGGIAVLIGRGGSAESPAASASAAPSDTTVPVPAEAPETAAVTMATPQAAPETQAPITTAAVNVPNAAPATSVIGTSVGGIPIRATTIGSGPKLVVVVGGIHGDQPEGASLPQIALDAWSADLASKITLVAVDHLNPDGLRRNRRANLNGVDLNRNFPARTFEPSGEHGYAPLDQPETKAFADLVLRDRPTLVLTGLSSAIDPNIVDYDGPSRSFAEVFASRSGFRAQVSGRRTPGSMGQWLGQDNDVPLISITYSRGASRSSVIRDSREGIAALLREVANS